ncbi:MAG TPA: FG-GAP-like repeat-containing protein [Candidatus Acidoferrales bacterium]|nr:FG-GAP-like repeat-containing protein [Candidatus Acidoferrales bacterium]
MSSTLHRIAILAATLFFFAFTLFLVRQVSHARAFQSTARAKVQTNTEAIHHNNLGVAYMERQEQKNALAEFQKAITADPHLDAARLNQAIALLNLQQFSQARSILDGIAEREPKNPRAWYNLGLLEKSGGHADASVADFERVAAIDPDDADTQYFVGQDYMVLRQYPRAIASFERALKINPFHVSAEFALAQALQRSGETPRARAHLVRFQHLVAAKLGAPMSLTYGDQGKYSLAEIVSAGVEEIPRPIPVHFVDATAESGLPTHPAPLDSSLHQDPASASFGSGGCVLDFDGAGRPSIFLVNADGSGHPRLYRNLGNGKFEDVTEQSGIAIPAVGMACTAGDNDNDSRSDLAVSYNGGVALFHNNGNGKFRDVTTAAGIHVTGQAMGLTFVDYDHDGDLDLYVARDSEKNGTDPSSATSPLNELWRNNGNGTFTQVSEETDVGGEGASWGATASDINNDRAVDFVVTSFQHPPTVYLNPREGKFQAEQPWTPAMQFPAVGALSFDFNKDGWMDLAFTHSGAPALSLWRNVNGKKFVPVALPKLNWTRGWGLAALDYDNDGWIDLAAVGETGSSGRIALLRNEGPSGFRDVSSEVGLDKIRLTHPRSLVAADFLGNGATDLLITQNGGPPMLLRNVGGNRNHWLTAQLTGLNDNKSAIGTKIDIYAGTLHQKFEITAASGYLGQSDTDITVGLNGASKVDTVRMLWPTGVLQDEINLRADSRQAITELDRRGSSCPLLFVWNGHTFQFVADIIGSGIVGHWVGPGERNIPNPAEYLKVNGSDVAFRDGQLQFRLVEPEEELDYLDQVRLLAVDHPPDAEVYPNGHFSMYPPFPVFKVVATRAPHLPIGAWDDRGRNVLPALLKRDHQFVTGFESTPFAGFAKLHWVELDLGNWNPQHPLRLILDGFTDYFSASSLYSAWQAGLKAIPPYIEALGTDGHWRLVVNNMGFFSGLERTMTADLTGKLPRGTRKIRIVTNLKIYFDRIRIDNSAADASYRMTQVPLANANLRFRGYPNYVEGKTPGDLTFIYDQVSATGPYAHQAGNYTRYGNVRPLLERVDEKYAVFGSGDEVAVSFDPSSLPKLARGWVRDYFFYANGFDKDMDFYADFGGTVTPLPTHTLVSYPYPRGIAYPTDPSHLDYLLRYNTRANSGRPSVSYRFHYRQR